MTRIETQFRFYNQYKRYLIAVCIIYSFSLISLAFWFMFILYNGIQEKDYLDMILMLTLTGLMFYMLFRFFRVTVKEINEKIQDYKPDLFEFITE